MKIAILFAALFFGQIYFWDVIGWDHPINFVISVMEALPPPQSMPLVQEFQLFVIQPNLTSFLFVLDALTVRDLFVLIAYMVLMYIVFFLMCVIPLLGIGSVELTRWVRNNQNPPADNAGG